MVTSICFVANIVELCFWVFSPSVSLDVEEEDYDDGITPLIPIIPIEEEESMDILPELAVALKPSPNVQSQNSQQYISAKTSISSASNASPAVSHLGTSVKEKV